MADIIFDLRKQLHETWSNRNRIGIQGSMSTSNISSGFQNLDRVVGGFRPSELIVLGGRSDMGLPALAFNMLECVASGQAMGKSPPQGDDIRQHPVAFFATEKTGALFAQRMICSHAGVSLKKIRSGFICAEDAEEKITLSTNYLRQLPVFLNIIKGNDMTVIKHRIKSLKRQHGIEFVVFDYIQMFHHFLFSHQGRVHELAAIAKSMKKMAVDNNIPVLVLSHITYPYKQHDKPTLSDFWNSDAIVQEANKVLLIRRPCKNPYDAEYPDKDLAIVDVAKNVSGSTGEVRLNFDEEINRFTDRP